MDIKDNEDEEPICARISNGHKKSVFNDKTKVRIEEIKYLGIVI